MLNFDFHNPTRILFGAGRIADLGGHVPPQARVLVLVGGGSAEASGTLAMVQQALGDRFQSTFSGIEANPQYETCLQAVEQVRAGAFDFLLAVGGGSVVDATKFIAAAALFEGDPWSILTTHGRNVEAALPFGCVLTLPATGSEMNSGAVISCAERGAKLDFSSPHCFAAVSVLDPGRTATLPPQQLANGVVDAFVHVVEQYLTYPAQARVQDRFAEGLLQTLLEVGPRVMASAEPVYEDRADLMWAATMALNGLIGAGVPHDWATHLIGHELTALYGIDHARTLAIVLPALLQEQRETKAAKLLQYAERVWGITEGDAPQRITRAIDCTRAFFEQLGVPTRLSDYGVPEDAPEAVAAQLQAHGLVQLGEHGNITPEVARRILAAAQ